MRFGRSDYDKRIIDKDNRIPEDEPVFLLRANDRLSPRLLLQWAMELRLLGGDPAMAENAENHAQKMIQWQKDHNCKTPDMYQDSNGRKLIREQIINLIDPMRGHQGYRLDVGKLDELLKAYYDTSISPKLQLIPIDLLPESINKPEELINLSDFNPDAFTVKNPKMIIYTNKNYISYLLDSKL